MNATDANIRAMAYMMQSGSASSRGSAQGYDKTLDVAELVKMHESRADAEVGAPAESKNVT